MKQVRLNIFETNSSASHALCIFTPEDFKQFVRGNVYVRCKDGVVDKLYRKEELVEYFLDKKKEYPDATWTEDYTREKLESMPDSDFIQLVYDSGDFRCMYDFTSNDYLEWDTVHFKTPGGENLVALCQYGYDG